MERLSLREAAERTARSVTTLRRYIRAQSTRQLFTIHIRHQQIGDHKIRALLAHSL